MPVHALKLVAILCWVTVVSPAFGESKRVTDPCRRVFVDLKRENGDDVFWRQNKVTVTLPDGRELPFAFGFDAELWDISDTIALVSRNPTIREQAKDAADYPTRLQLGDHMAPRRKQSYTAKELAERMGYATVEEFREKALRTEAHDKSRGLQLVDLKLSALPRLKTTLKKDKNYHGWTLLDSVNRALLDSGYPVQAIREVDRNWNWQGTLGGGASIEIRQSGPTTSPADFHDTIKNFLYKTFRHPETHFHVSIPTAAINDRRMMMAARALETKIILEEAAANLKDEDIFYPYDHSVLAVQPSPALSESRGAVRVSPARWRTPVTAHDVEIRQWLDADNGLSNIRFMVELVKQQNRLRDTADSFVTKYIPRMAPSNLHSSLLYAAHMLRDRLPFEDQGLVQGLEELGWEIQSTGKVTPEMRRKVASFLKRNEVLTYINVETFLEPRR